MNMLSGGGALNSRKLARLVAQKIEAMRPKLLDLTARNPLIKTRLTHRSGSHIRVVDELPDVLFFRLKDGKPMRFVPLPALDIDPRDEDTADFRDAMAVARASDEDFIAASELLDPDTDDALKQVHTIERKLKDRVRADLGMRPRQSGDDPDFAAHAKNHGISPNYDLPLPGKAPDDGRHEDGDIQTLQLPRDLERKLVAIVNKGRIWSQETGVNVLHAAFGMLEWSEPDRSTNNLSPLVLMEVSLKQKKASGGLEIWVSGLGEAPEVNGVLAEKLRRDLGVELPAYEGGSVEDYMKAVADCAPGGITWRVRRQVVFGVFPSSRLAMFHDLDTNEADFAEHEVVKALLAGRNLEEVAPFAEDYNIDDPAIEAKVPLIVADADSSQMSALVDIANGRNLAVEGPPGTGKSQTIVNAIAAAMAAGKKVLFVAEKTAALEVVKSRLEALGLGDFILPLQAGRSTREQIIRSVRKRVELRPPVRPDDIADTLERFRKVRAEIADYLDLTDEVFEETGQTVHEILGRNIELAGRLENVPAAIRDDSDFPEKPFSRNDIHDLLEKIGELDAANAALGKMADHWKDIGVTDLEPFAADAVLDMAREAARKYEKLSELQTELFDVGFPQGTSRQLRLQFLVFLERLDSEVGFRTVEDAHLLLPPETRAKVGEFLSDCRTCLDACETLSNTVNDPLDEGLPDKIRAIAAACEQGDLATLDVKAAHEKLGTVKTLVGKLEDLSDSLREYFEYVPYAAEWSLAEIHQIGELAREAGRHVLALRQKFLGEESSLAALRLIVEYGSKLREREKQISDVLPSSNAYSKDEVLELVAVLRGRGRFAGASKKFRQARKRYLSIASETKFDPAEAASNLQMLVEFRNDRDRFAANQRCKALLGPHFQGIDTDLEGYKHLIAYYDSVDSNFSGAQNRQIRDFLKTGETDLLVSAPDVSIFNREVFHEEFRTYLTKHQRSIARIEEALGKVEEHLGVFVDARDVPVRDLKEIADEAEELIAFANKLDDNTEVREPLGEEFAGWRTQAELASTILGLMDGIPSPDHFAAPFHQIAKSGNLRKVHTRLQALRAAEENAYEILKRAAEAVVVDAGYFDRGRDLPEMAAYLTAAAADREGLFAHARAATARHDLEGTGVMSAVEALLANPVEGQTLGETVEALIYRKLARRVYAAYGEKLTRYTGEALDGLRGKLAELDVKIIRHSRRKLRADLASRAGPPAGNGVGLKSEYTEMSLVLNEISKKKRFIPVRDLTARAGQALLELKPCWMMSPLAVAQYVPKGSIQFDLCIVDEASQMPPEDALGAIFRSNQVMIVGDTNQLPPTSFFRKMLDDEDDEETETVIEESILELANSTFRPTRRLRWHYRSRHASLIEFSNRLIYDDDLIVFPSPTERGDRMGVSLKTVEGAYKSGLNPEEARAIVAAATTFMAANPDQSLGIVTLNKRQAEYIQELFYNDAALNVQHVADYLERWDVRDDGLQSFFIKNLENVQGDERDTIFISTVYGPEKPGGPVMQRFGPVNGLAGRRRLNVLFSRARRQIVTFTSMKASDVRAEADGNPGAHMLRRWLEYSQTGQLEAGEVTRREPQSAFERHVIAEIEKMGCEAVPQVGVAGYFVDIGVRHKDYPNGFVLGIECDGASYHSARSARDRDRLRQQILEGLGWKLHRIWSTDWFANPAAEMDKLRMLIEDRAATLKKMLVTGQPAEPEVASDGFIAEPDDEALDSATTAGGQEEGDGADGDARPVFGRKAREIEVGDTVRLRYTTDADRIMQVTIGDRNDPDIGMINPNNPIAQSILGAEEGDEVDILAGSQFQRAVIEEIVGNERRYH